MELQVERKLNFNLSITSPHFDHEWLIANGLGGYASMNLMGSTTRKYHGLLVAALPAPLGRMIMFNFVQESIRLNDGSIVNLTYEETLNGDKYNTPLSLEFKLENGLPVWLYTLTNNIKIEKRIFLRHQQNTVHLMYKLIDGTPSVELYFRPFFQFRHYETSVKHSLQDNFEFKKIDSHYEICIPSLPIFSLYPESKAQYVQEQQMMQNVRYRIEEERGYDSIGNLFSPAYFLASLVKDEFVNFIASTEDPETLINLSSLEALQLEKERRLNILKKSEKYSESHCLSTFVNELLLAADQFVISPTRRSDIAWMHAHGIEARSIIAGYHWFTDWGRDTMISLEGLLLISGQFLEAKCILETFLHHLKDGLIPNMFPDKENNGIYNTADATLWFFHAVERYLAYTNDNDLIKSFLPKIKDILEHHLRGTLFGIRVDPDDGLLIQGEQNYALTWMDAKLDNFVVTPRRGKAVEINGLWYNAISLALEWFEMFGDNDDLKISLEKIKKLCYESFNNKFWCAEKGYLYDVIEGQKGNDNSCRPNQLFSFSLKYPILNREKWKNVLEIVQNKLLTPFGLRTLSSDHPDYKVVYLGNLFLRDSAYHQGTIWPWLIGPFIDAWLKIYPQKPEEGLKFLDAFREHLNEGGIGFINEIFDAESPFIHRGCIAQAWSISEVIRSLIQLGKKKF